MSVKSISCPNCGGSVELRGMTHTLSAVCVNCLSVLDASTPQVRAVQQFQEGARVQPKIPLGTRGKIDGHVWEILGFQRRTIVSGGVSYHWYEYLLFNPYQGFRYLSEYNGHWNFIKPLKGLPYINSQTKITYDRANYKHFQSAQATTDYAMGEFPWKVKVDDQVWVTDYVAPPLLISREGTQDEQTWSVGTYKTADEIGKAFSSALPSAQGVFANQPNPHTVGSVWRTCLWLTVLLYVTMVAFGLLSNNQRVFRQQYTFSGVADDTVTSPQFQIEGNGPQNVEIAASTNLSDDWLYLGVLLVNAVSGDAYIGGRLLETESSNSTIRESVTFAQIPPGRYYLRVEPEMDKASPTLRYGRAVYDVEVWRDVPHYLLFWLAVPMMALPAIFATFRKAAFETARWQESDHASSDSSSSESDD